MPNELEERARECLEVIDGHGFATQAEFDQAHFTGRQAIAAMLAFTKEAGWMPIEQAPDDAPFIAGLWVTNNKTGQRWWESFIVAIDDEDGHVKGHPDGEPLPWALSDFEAFRPLPAPPGIDG